MKKTLFAILFVSTLAGAQNYGPFADYPTVHNATEVAEFDRVFEMAVNNLSPRRISRIVQAALIGAEVPSGTETVATGAVVNNRAFNPKVSSSLVSTLTLAVAYKASQRGDIPDDAKGYDRNIAVAAATDEIENTAIRARFFRLLDDLLAGLPDRE